MSDLAFSCAGNAADANNSLTTLGTLMWIGSSTSPEFSDAYQDCLARVAQLAMRRNFDDALCRPASAVRCILVAQSTRQRMDRRCLEILRETYPQASFLNLRGTLCEGAREPIEPVFGRNQHYWHRWNQILPEWLGSCGVANEPSQQSSQQDRRSVAVLTSSFVAGEALMDLAESAGATAVWCRSAETHRVRNVDTVWWDDSVAGPTSSLEWKKRISAFDKGERSPQHAWIVNAPRVEEQRQATRGGVDLVVSKPHRIDCLVAMLSKHAQAADHDLTAISRAA